MRASVLTHTCGPLHAGAFKIQVAGKLCSDNTKNGFFGESAEITLTAGAADTDVTITARE
jgi:hypothetical protein